MLPNRSIHATLTLVLIMILTQIPITIYGQDGTLDTTFGTNGIAITDIDSSSDDFASSMAIQSDGKIVMAGNTFAGSDGNFAVVRYNSDGSLDSNFDGDGIVTTDIGSGYDEALSIAIQSDGKIVVAGETDNGSNFDFAVVRYNSDGSLDNNFDGDGIVTTDIGSEHNLPYSVAIQSDGKIVVAGKTYNGSNSDIALIRYNPDGSLDNNFDGDGIVTADIGSSFEYASSITTQSDGKIVVAVRTEDFTALRYNPNGSLDSNFDGDGIVTTDIGNSSDRAYSIAIQNDGKIVVAGHTKVGSFYRFAVVRYKPDGSLDNNFDGDGTAAITNIGGYNDQAYSMAIQNDGKIVVAGRTRVGNYYRFAVVRYNPDGSLDSNFNGDGIITTDIDSSTDGAYSVAIQDDGKIVVAGTSNSDFAVVRYNNSPVSSVELTDELISEYSLSQNYPNPFNPTTKISWQSAVGSWQTLKVYDVLGREVATLVNEYKPAGNYEVTFNASKLSSGVYFYQLNAGKFISTKKLLLLK